MIIKKLILSGYNRLLNTGITEINIVPQNKITLIIGTNGSGKSSLLKELTPLPAISQEYSKTGFKYVEIEHDNKFFNLLTDFSANKKHSFVVDGVEMNQSGNLQMQRELVKQYFNITQEVHDLMLGVKNFHRMSPKERNDWFNKLCSTDYSFALSFYNKIKEVTRDTQGALNLIKSKKVQELTKKENLEQRNSLVIYKNQLELCLDNILKFNTSSDPIFLEKNIEQYNILIKEIKKYSKYIFNKIKTNSNNKYKSFSIEQIKEKIRNLELELKGNETTLNIRGNDLQNLLSIQNYSKDENGVFDINKRMEELKEKIDNTKTPSIVFEDNSSALSVLSSIINEISNLLNEISSYDGSKYSKAKLVSCQEEMNKIVVNNENINKDLIRVNNLLTMAEVNKRVCPKCTYSWSENIETSEIERYKKKVKGLTEVYNRNNDKLEELKAYHEECSSYINYYNAIVSIITSTPILKPIWNIASRDKLVTRDPRALRVLLENTQRDLLSLIEKDKLQAEYNSLKTSLNIIQVNGSHGRSISDEIKEMQVNIDNLYVTNRELKDNLEKITTIDNVYTDLKEKKEALSDLLNKISIVDKNIHDSIEAAKVTKFITFIRKELSNVNDKINEIAVNEQHLKYLDEEEENHKLNLDICKILTDSMSPKSGLLAMGMSGFINDTLRKMNDIISKIWTYPLELLPCNVDDGENLDYRFPMRVGEDNIISDINIGSSAMKEIVDLAFRLVTMRYLQLDYYPVFIDELGAAFDEKHREAAFDLIKKMAESDDFSQLFLVSHYSDCYGSLSNVSTIILSDTNITLTDHLITSSCCNIKRT